MVQIAVGLKRRGWDVSVCCLFPRGALVDDLEAHQIPVTCLGIRGMRDILQSWRLVRQLRQTRPSIVQTFLHHGNLVGRIAAALARVPIVCSGIRVAEHRSQVRLWLDRLTERLVSRHICVSEAVSEFSRTRGGLAQEKLVVIGNGVELARFEEARALSHRELGLPQVARVILFAGRLDPQKNPELLLRAFAELSGEFPELHLMLAGVGPLRQALERLAAEQHVSSRVHFLGRRDDIPSLLKSSEMLVLPSRWEGMPNVVLEAMAAAVPVIATRVEGSTELIRDGETGLLVASEDVAELARAIHSLLCSPELRRGVAERAFEDVARHRSWERVVDAYEATYAAEIAAVEPSI